MLKIILLGITAMFLAMLAGNIKKEYGILIAVCTAVLIFSYGISKISAITEKLQEFQKLAGMDEKYLSILLKMVGIAYLTQFAVNLCKDAGHGTIASQIGFVGKLSMLVVSIPVLEALIRTIGEMFA